MAGLTLSPVICTTPHLRHNELRLTSLTRQSASLSVRRDLRWRTRATLEDGVADAKRVIEGVLRTRADDALYADEATMQLLEDAVTKLGACRGRDFGEFLRSRDSHGVWEVFYAPHIFRLSSALRTQIRPLQYILSDAGFSSHAHYFCPVGAWWPSGAGDYVMRDGKTVESLFEGTTCSLIPRARY